MTTDTDLIARADAAIDSVQNAPKGLVDPFYVAQSAALVPNLRDALAAALARATIAETLRDDAERERNNARDRVEAAECHAEALEAELASGSFYKESDIDAMQDRIKALSEGEARLSLLLNERSAENARLRDALEEAAGYGCTCDPAYYKRGLAAPDCLANLVSDDAREALGVPPVCKGSAAALAAFTDASAEGGAQ